MLMAQASLDRLLENVEGGNPELIRERQLLEARRLDAATGLTPSNPEVEFAYLWGRPEQLGDRIDFSVMQSFDFPTVYASKNRLSDVKKEQAGLEYETIRQGIHLKARQAWINRVYLNIVNKLLMERLAHAETVLSGFERKNETGEANQLQLNQARMKVTAIDNQVSLLNQKISMVEAELMNLTGNHSVSINDTILPDFGPMELDSLLAAYQQGYLNQVYQSEVEKRSREADVIFNEKLPKLQAGYYSESILGTKLQGIQAGISIPLWENARAVKSARARVLYAQTSAEVFWKEKQNEVRQQFIQWTYLKERVMALEEMLVDSNDEYLLRKAMEAGEVSLTEYFYESDFYFQNVLSLLEFKKEMLMLEASLKKVYY